METFVRAALLGTANAPGGSHLTGTPVDALVAPAAADGERRLLLAAGAASIYLQAGRKPARAAALPEPAPEDSRPACGPAAASVLRELMTGEHRMLLPEACSRMAAAGLRLSPDLLPAALTVPAAFRPAIRQVLGERGRWLAQFNESWAWARTLETAPDAPDDALPSDAERVWEEGSLDERVAILRRVRAVDPALARSWLAPVLSKEKAEPRSRLLSTLETGLGPDDEALLEGALDDRSVQVRSTAGLLLARLPASACARRLRERADALLSAEEGKTASGVWGRVTSLLSGGGFRLTIEPPQEVDRAWERDGLAANPPQGMGKRAFWLVQALSRVPPAHWVERFSHGPAELLAAAARDSEWGGAVAEGWTRAAIGFSKEDWAAPLWDFGRGKSAPEEMKELLPRLVDLMPPAEREPRIEALLSAPPSGEPLVRYLEQLPSPWSPELARRYHDRTRRLASEEPRGDWQASEAWLATLPVAALALPLSSFGLFLMEWPVDRIESPTWYQRTWAERLQELRERLRLRLTLYKEIPT
jgi:hypothetical protein